jgi:hypothetical protein
MARFAALLCVLALVAPGAALAQGGGAFDPLPPAPPEQPTTVPQEGRGADDDGLSSTQQLLIAMSGFILLFGIGWLIVRDARSAAPVETRPAPGAADSPQPKGSRTPAGVRHRTNRAKAKAARQARKKARKR